MIEFCDKCGEFWGSNTSSKCTCKKEIVKESVFPTCIFCGRSNVHIYSTRFNGVAHYKCYEEALGNE